MQWSLTSPGSGIKCPIFENYFALFPIEIIAFLLVSVVVFGDVGVITLSNVLYQALFQLIFLSLVDELSSLDANVTVRAGVGFAKINVGSFWIIYEVDIDITVDLGVAAGNVVLAEYIMSDAILMMAKLIRVCVSNCQYRSKYNLERVFDLLGRYTIPAGSDHYFHTSVRPHFSECL